MNESLAITSMTEAVSRNRLPSCSDSSSNSATIAYSSSNSNASGEHSSIHSKHDDTIPSFHSIIILYPNGYNTIKQIESK